MATEAAAAVKQEEEEKKEIAKGGGEILFCGSPLWESLGKKSVDFSTTNILAPTRLRSLMGINISFVAAGCASCHCVALDVDGRCYTWGRNDKGQLGHGDLTTYQMPTIVSGLSKYKVVNAGAGKSHTVVVTEDGISLAFGWNKHGQLGTGSTRNEVESLPVRCLVTQATAAVCGAEFTVWLSSVEGSSILTAGLPQYGQLGHGTDNEYNAKESSVRLAYEAQPRPRPIAFFSGKTVTKVACGHNHTVAIDSNGFVYTWGFGGYGRLGHKEQKDEWTPRIVDMFQRHNVLPPEAVVAAGTAFSSCSAGGGQLYMWGRVKATGDNWMYPKPLYDLSGWSIRCIDSGNTHSICGADDSCISWGLAQCGELGYGSSGPKSSANPKKIDSLEGMHVLSVACGFSHSIIVVDRSNMEDKIGKLDVFDGNLPSEDLKTEEKVSNKKQPANKRKTPADNKTVEVLGKPEKKPRKKASKKEDSESENGDDYDDADDDSDEDVNGLSNSHSKNQSRGRGRGRGRGSASSHGTASGRGRSNASRGRGKGKTAKSGKAK